MNNSKRDRLIQLLRNPSPEMRAHLEKSKADGLRGGQRSDFVWHYLLQSFSTMGNSRGWKGLIDNKENYRLVTFNALSKLSSRARDEWSKILCGVRLSDGR